MKMIVIDWSSKKKNAQRQNNKRVALFTYKWREEKQLLQHTELHDFRWKVFCSSRLEFFPLLSTENNLNVMHALLGRIEYVQLESYKK